MYMLNVNGTNSQKHICLVGFEKSFMIYWQTFKAQASSVARTLLHFKSRYQIFLHILYSDGNRSRKGPNIVNIPETGSVTLGLR